MASVTTRSVWSVSVLHVSTPSTANAANAMARRPNRFLSIPRVRRSGFRLRAHCFPSRQTGRDGGRASLTPWTAQLWCTGKDSNLRTSLGGADLQSAGFNHSPTCAETAPLRAEKTLPWTLRSSHTLPESPVHRQLRETEICARTAAQEHIYRSEKFLMECVWKTCRAAASAALPGKSLSGAGEGIRTPDPLITNQMLYQLSYASTQGFRLLRRKSPC